jgi:hypothetical protein
VGDIDGDGAPDDDDVPTIDGDVWIGGNVGINDTAPDGMFELNPDGVEDNNDEIVMDWGGGLFALNLVSRNNISATNDINAGNNIVAANNIIAGVACICPSTKEKKKDIKYLSKHDYEEILMKLDTIEVATYRWKRNVDANDEIHIGIISEEAPDEIVTEDRKAINTTDYLGFLMAAIKAQQSEIQFLKGEINKLKNRL